MHNMQLSTAAHHREVTSTSSRTGSPGKERAARRQRAPRDSAVALEPLQELGVREVPERRGEGLTFVPSSEHCS